MASSCNPAGGIEQAAEGALPEHKRYVEGPGERLREGPWKSVTIDADYDTLYHVGARRLDDAEPTFHLFGADVEQGCQVSPNASTWLVPKPEQAPYRLVPYLESSDPNGRGTLRFTTLDCQVEEMSIERAGKPYDVAYATGFVVPSDDGLWFADPWRDEKHLLVSDLQGHLSWTSTVLLWGDGKLKSFDNRLQPVAELGEDVVAVVPLGATFLVEDSAGLHLVDYDPETAELVTTPVLPDACGLQRYPLAVQYNEYWVALHSPCDDPQLTAVRLDIRQQILEERGLGIEAQARHARVSTRYDVTGELEELAVFYLTDVDESGYGTLWVAREGEVPLQLGERATLFGCSLRVTGERWAGDAYVDYEEVAGRTTARWLRFDWQGERKTVAERLLVNEYYSDFIVNFDGAAGDQVIVSDDELIVLTEGVPPFPSAKSSYVEPDHRARIDRYDGTSGRLSLVNLELEGITYRDLAQGVPPSAFRFAWFMPALFFLEDYDAELETGTLSAYNYDLDARMLVAPGVSSFDLTTYPWAGVLYAVPRGKNQGIWFAKAK
jgi:hypothetical protein